MKTFNAYNKPLIYTHVAISHATVLVYILCVMLDDDFFVACGSCSLLNHLRSKYSCIYTVKYGHEWCVCVCVEKKMKYLK